MTVQDHTSKILAGGLPCMLQVWRAKISGIIWFTLGATTVRLLILRWDSWCQPVLVWWITGGAGLVGRVLVMEGRQGSRRIGDWRGGDKTDTKSELVTGLEFRVINCGLKLPYPVSPMEGNAWMIRFMFGSVTLTACSLSSYSTLALSLVEKYYSTHLQYVELKVHRYQRINADHLQCVSCLGMMSVTESIQIPQLFWGISHMHMQCILGILFYA